MKQIAVGIVACVLLLSLTVHAADWSRIADGLSKSVVYIETKAGSCTGFVVHSHASKDGDKDYVLTAAHCDGPEIYVDQAVAKVLMKDTKKDLMVLEVEDLGRPALIVAKDNPKRGAEVMSFGYGYGLERPMLRVTHIADDETYIPENGIGGPLLVTDATFVSGMSGGPVINEAGEVVMIVQRASNSFGMGVGAETIRSKAGRYFERVVKP